MNDKKTVFLTYREAANAIQCAGRQIYTYIEQGKLDYEIQNERKMIIRNAKFEKKKSDYQIYLAKKKRDEFRKLINKAEKIDKKIAQKKEQQQDTSKLELERNNIDDLIEIVKSGCLTYAQDNTTWAKLVIDIGNFELKRQGLTHLSPEMYYDIIHELVSTPKKAVLAVGGYRGESDKK